MAVTSSGASADALSFRAPRHPKHGVPLVGILTGKTGWDILPLQASPTMTMTPNTLAIRGEGEDLFVIPPSRSGMEKILLAAVMNWNVRGANEFLRQ